VVRVQLTAGSSLFVKHVEKFYVSLNRRTVMSESEFKLTMAQWKERAKEVLKDGLPR
jgi:hypothetical protein